MDDKSEGLVVLGVPDVGLIGRDTAQGDVDHTLLPDIPALVQHFLEKLASGQGEADLKRVTEETMEILAKYEVE